MRIAVGMSGGVDSSVAAMLLQQEGHDVIGVTLALWAGDEGRAHARDAEDARRVAKRLGIEHHVVDLSDEFNANVIDPYLKAHQAGETPNPCVQCNRTMKFTRFLDAAQAIDAEAVATGHYARIDRASSVIRIRRGVDVDKDQSYVLHVLSQQTLKRVHLPLGSLTKAQTRELASNAGLETANRPDSLDICFVSKEAGRAAFVGERIALHPARMKDAATGEDLGEIPDVELVTIGQRKGMGGGTPQRRYAVDVDVAAREVRVGNVEDLAVNEIVLRDLTWVHEPLRGGDEVLVQTSAHGATTPGVIEDDRVRLGRPIRRVAPGQSVVFYNADEKRGDEVRGGGIACR